MPRASALQHYIPLSLFLTDCLCLNSQSILTAAAVGATVSASGRTETMSDTRVVLDGLKPTILMVLVQILYVGINVLYKLAVIDGMSLKVVIAYRFVFASAFMAPLALFFERKKQPKMTWTILFQALLCGLFGGTLAQTLYLETLALVSATFASAMNNLIPAITFLLALFFGLEKLNLRTAIGKAKVIGTLTGIGGAMLLTFFKGAEIDTSFFHVTLLPHQDGHVASSHSSVGGSTLLGALCALGSIISLSIWLIVQSKMSERYPCHYSSATLMNVMASVFSIAFALCTEKDWSQWRLGWNIRLLTVSYAGLVPAGISVVIIAWCVRMRGPLFVSIFNPLLLLMLALLGSFFMDEKLHLGSIIGGVLIVCGLYVVLWGKGKEMKKMNRLVPSQTTLDVSPTVEIIVNKSLVDDDKSNHDNNINTSNLVRNHEGASEYGNEVKHDDNQRKDEVVLTNVSEN